MALTPAIADAYRNVLVTTPGTYGGVGGTATSKEVGGTLNLDAGFGITLVTDVSDPANPKITIVNTGNGTGALTTINDNNSAGTYYPIFTRAPGPGDINIPTGTYQMDTMYLDQTTTPLTYNPSTSTLSLTHLTVEGVTSTGATGTGKFVFDTSPSVTGLSSNTVLVGSQANFTRFPNALAAISSIDISIQQNESGNIGLIAEGKGGSSTYGAGVFGAGYSAGGLPGYGVIGNAHVTATGDIASAIAVRGYSNDIHAGGKNIALYGYAGNGSNNYALYMTGGDIYSDIAQTWTIADNSANALSLDATGKTGILKVITTNAAEGIEMSGTLSVTGHVTVEGVTSTGATGTGKFVFDNAPTISGHPTIEGVTSTGATGTGKFVFDTSPTFSAPSISGTSTSITNVGTFALRDTSAAFDLTLAATSSTALTAGRTLTFDVGDAARTVKLLGNIDIGGTFTTSNQFTVAGAYTATITAGGVFNATFPGGTYTLPKNDQTFYVGTTSIAINRASAALSLTGINGITSDGTSLLALDSNSTGDVNLGTGATAKAISIGNTTVASTITLNNNTTINGTLTVTGTTVTLNSRTITVDDKNLELGSVTATTGLQATLATGTNAVTLTTGTTDNLIPGQKLTSTGGTGAFATGVGTGFTVNVINTDGQSVTGVSVQTGGTGYSVNDVLYISGGTAGWLAYVVVTATTGVAGVVSTVSILYGGLGNTGGVKATTYAINAGPYILDITGPTTFTVNLNHATNGAITFSAGGPTDVTAEGGGITVKGSNDHKLTYSNGSDGWLSTDNIDLPNLKSYKINGRSVISSSVNAVIIGDTETNTIYAGSGGGNRNTDTTLLVGGDSSNTINFNGTTSSNATITANGTGTASIFDTNLLTGTLFGAATSVTIGTTTAASTYNIATGATLNATTKAINIGTAGVSGSTTNIAIGSSVSGALGTTTIPRIVIPAGTAAANTAPLKITTGTVLTTAEAGAVEYDGNAFYATTNYATAGRSVIPATYKLILNAVQLLGPAGAPALNTDYSLFTTATTAGFNFAGSTAYNFEGFVHITKGATSTIPSFKFIITTGSLTSILYDVQAVNVAAAGAATAPVNSYWTAATGGTILAAGSTTTGFYFYVRGVMRTNVAGKIAPTISFSAAPGATTQTNVNSWFQFTPVGSSTVTNIGVWT